MAPAAFGMLSGLRSLLLSFARFLAHEAITAVKNFFFEWSSAHGVQEACVVDLFFELARASFRGRAMCV